MKFTEWHEYYIKKMTTVVSGHSYDHNPQDMGDIASYLSTKIFGRYFGPRKVVSDKILSAKDIKKIDEVRWITRFYPDEVTDPKNVVGNIELDYNGLPLRKCSKFIKAVKFYLDELNVKFGSFDIETHQTAMRQEIERSRGFGENPDTIEKWHKKITRNNLNRVCRVRIPILHIPDLPPEGPPSFWLSVVNMHHIIGGILHLRRFKTSNGYFIPTKDLIESIENTDGRKLMCRNSVALGGQIDSGFYASEIRGHLEILESIGEWALEYKKSDILIV
jgi:hypothetical protein